MGDILDFNKIKDDGFSVRCDCGILTIFSDGTVIGVEQEGDETKVMVMDVPKEALKKIMIEWLNHNYPGEL